MIQSTHGDIQCIYARLSNIFKRINKVYCLFTTELTVHVMTSQKSTCVANYSIIILHIEIIQARDSCYIAS